MPKGASARFHLALSLHYPLTRGTPAFPTYKDIPARAQDWSSHALLMQPFHLMAALWNDFGQLLVPSLPSMILIIAFALHLSRPQLRKIHWIPAPY